VPLAEHTANNETDNNPRDERIFILPDGGVENDGAEMGYRPLLS
jgi:hypothetical protein